ENQTLEVHLFECESDLYNKELRLSFLEKIREEQKFDSLEELKIQLEKDKEICKRTLTEKYLH
ncbi:MAG: riboflavin kinase, partial [Flavobacteriaceae bacterium]